MVGPQGGALGPAGRWGGEGAGGATPHLGLPDCLAGRAGAEWGDDAVSEAGSFSRGVEIPSSASVKVFLVE